MKAEFMKDENGNIWFYYASDIQVRPSKAKHNNLYDNSKAQAARIAEQKKQMI